MSHEDIRARWESGYLHPHTSDTMFTDIDTLLAENDEMRAAIAERCDECSVGGMNPVCPLYPYRQPEKQEPS